MKNIKTPYRTNKSRDTGITSIHDVGIPLEELKNILDSYSRYLDFAKFGVGSAYVEPKLREKIDLYTEHDVEIYFGGTLFEKFYHQGKFDEYLDFLQSFGVSWLEISSGTVDIRLSDRVEMVKESIEKGFSVIAEVGEKVETSVMPPSEWMLEIQTLLSAGCVYVVAEGRDGCNAGLYRPNGEIREGLLSDMTSKIDTKHLIFEASNSSSQAYLINHLGANVNLGNVNPRDLLLLESQRQSLRSETFFNES